MGNYIIDRIEFGNNTYILKDSTSGYIASTSAFTGNPSANAAPSFGGTFTISQIAQDTKAQVSGTDRTITIPSTLATYNTRGLVQPLFSNSAVATGAAATSSSVSVSVQARGTTSNRFYGIEADSSGHLYVNVSWTDTKVTQTNTTTNSEYRVLFSANANDTTETTTARKNTNLKYNPSTGTITTNTVKSLNTVVAERGIFNELIATSAAISSLNVNNLTAQNATVVGLLDVKGELHTNKWTNANIANIGGSFYISPTVSTEYAGSSVMSVGISTASDSSYTMAVSGGDFETGIVKIYDEAREEDVPLLEWPVGSRVMVTGNIRVGDNGVDYPLGTCTGYLSAALDSGGGGFTVSGINSAALEGIIGETGATSFKSKKIQISMYEIGGSSSGTKPVGIMMQSYGVDKSTYMDVYGGVNIRSTTTPFAVNPNVRVGYLGDLPSLIINGVNHKPVGWGIYTDNGYFQGLIIANSGIIGGWELNLHALTADRAGQGTETSISNFIVLSDGKSDIQKTILGKTTTEWSFAIGGDSNNNGKIGITADGDLYASTAYLGNGKIGPFSYDASKINYEDETAGLKLEISIENILLGSNNRVQFLTNGNVIIGNTGGGDYFTYVDDEEKIVLNLTEFNATTGMISQLTSDQIVVNTISIGGQPFNNVLDSINNHFSSIENNINILSTNIDNNYYTKIAIDNIRISLLAQISSTKQSIIEEYLSFLNFDTNSSLTATKMYIGKDVNNPIMEIRNNLSEISSTSFGISRQLFFENEGNNNTKVKRWAVRLGATVNGRVNLNDVWIGG